MKERVKFFIGYSLFWMAYFTLIRLMFLIYQFRLSLHLSIIDWFRVLIHGIPLDLSVLGYVLIIPVLLLIFTGFYKNNVLYHALKVYTILLLTVFSILVVIDLELYRNWRFRLDSTPLLYINKPKEMLASSQWYIILLGIVLMAALITFSVWMYNKYVGAIIRKLPSGGWLSPLIFLIVLPSLILPIRGGLDTSPINVATVYFSKNIFANHAAINVLWNFGNSLTFNELKSNPYTFFSNQKAEKYFSTVENEPESPPPSLLKVKKPNIVLLIFESLTSKVIEPLGGIPGVMPNFNKLTKEGVFFTNMIASGDRSDKGIVAILSGYPSLGVTAIMKFPKKTQTLPFLSRSLAAEGYTSTFYYGGDINFFNLRTYMINGGFNKIIYRDDFDRSEDESSWGVPDQFVFSRVADDIEKEKGPFFKVFFTLSNHEPFDVPMKTVIPGMDGDSKFCNASYYVDKCLGDFISRLKKSPKWDSTLIVMIADHGSPIPGNTAYTALKKFTIPMLWVGGALKKDSVVAKYASQVDLSRTLLDQLGLPATGYHFSKDILSPNSLSYAVYAYSGGFAYISDSVKFNYDLDVKKPAVVEGTPSDSTVDFAKGYMQVLYNDFLSR